MLIVQKGKQAFCLVPEITAKARRWPFWNPVVAEVLPHLTRLAACGQP
jgi:hypothetical protein